MIEISGQHRPARLFQVMIVLSFLIHAVLFLHVFGLNTKRLLSVIEMDVENEFKSRPRLIPRHRPTPVKAEIADKILPRMPSPSLPFIEPESRAYSAGIMESVSAPSSPAENVAGLSGMLTPGNPGLLSKKDYIDMIRMKIESSKIYPVNARNRMVEGFVTVRFTVTLDGQTSSVSIARSSGNHLLDQAAINAVNDSGPFAQPPASLFKAPVKMEITIRFELT